MQIIIAQAEIEKAITNYIRDLITVKDSTNISIELTAGRGADGFKATIELTEQSQKATVLTRAVVATSVTETSIATEAAPVVTEEEEVTTLITKEQAAAEEPQVTTEVAEPAPKKGPSLFANLDRPKNAV